jgi:acetyl-CoA synthetase
MVYTSGTTGAPKGALHAHRVLIGHLPGIEFSHEFLPQDGDRFWTPADWAWAGGLLNVLLPGLHYGVPVVSARFDKFDPEQAFALMARMGVRNAFIPPTALRMLRSVPPPQGRHAICLRSVGSGGEALGAEILEWGKSALGLTINEFYGQTECNIVLASCAAIGVSRAGAIGKPVPGHTVAVIRPDGSECAAGDLGQIAIARPDPVMFLGYWNKPDATAEKFIGNWMTTGDQGVTEADGYVRFVGRDDDVITSAGYRIGPFEVESALVEHPQVVEAAAVAAPDPDRGSIVKAYVVLRPGAPRDAALVAELQEHVKRVTAPYKYPRAIEFVDDLPKTVSGKIRRVELRERERRRSE